MKISDHWVRSPLLNINRACQGCHKFPEAEIKARVELIQDRTFEMRNRTLNAVIGLIDDIHGAAAAGKTDVQLAAARQKQRRAQFLLDFVEAENSGGFHAPQEAARILNQAMDEARLGQLAVRDLPPAAPVAASSAKPAAR